MLSNKCHDNGIIGSGTKGKDVRRFNVAEMKQGQGDSDAVLSRKKRTKPSSIKGELVPLVTSMVQKWKMARWMKRLHLA